MGQSVELVFMSESIYQIFITLLMNLNENDGSSFSRVNIDLAFGSLNTLHKHPNEVSCNLLVAFKPTHLYSNQSRQVYPFCFYKLHSLKAWLKDAFFQ